MSLLWLLTCIASSFKTKRTYSTETIHEYTNDGDDSDDSHGDGQALDLAALKRARRENPGTISILGSLAGTDGKIGDDEAKANAEKLRELFELSSTEKIVTGKYDFAPSDVRISGLAVEECHDTRLYASNRTSCLFLCSTAEDERISHCQIPANQKDTVIKTGYLYKKSRHTPRRHRHWFILKNDVLSYYDDPAVRSHISRLMSGPLLSKRERRPSVRSECRVR
jgi:PH domain